MRGEIFQLEQSLTIVRQEQDEALDTHNQVAEQIKALDDELRDWNEGLDNHSFSLRTFCPKSKKKRNHQDNSAGGMT
jgi:hypothetical protein